MSPKDQYRPYWALAVVLAGALACAGCRHSQGDARTPVGDVAVSPDDDAVTIAEQPGESAPEEASGQPNTPGDGDQAAEESGGPAGAAETKPERHVMTEDEFVEVAVIMKTWQNAIANTREGQEKLDQLVRQLLDSKGLKPSDFRRFEASLHDDPNALGRIEGRIEERLAELNKTHFEVDTKGGKGTEVLEEGSIPASKADGGQ